MAKPKSAKHVAAGHAKREAGGAFEQRAENAIVAAEQDGWIVFWAHTQPLFTFSGRPVAPGHADFSGVLRGGLAFAIEVKSILDKAYPKNLISDEQIRHLNAVSAQGGLALFALEFRDKDTGARWQHFIPWHLVPWRMARSAWSVRRQDVTDYLMASEHTLAAHVEPCEHCGAMLPKRAVRYDTCCG